MNGEKIKEIREKHNISQKKLGEMLGVHLRTIQNWENGCKIPKSKEALIRNITCIDEPNIEIRNAKNSFSGNKNSIIQQGINVSGEKSNSIVSSNVAGDAVLSAILPDTITEIIKNYKETIKKQQEQMDKLIEVINKLSTK